MKKVRYYFPVNQTIADWWKYGKVRYVKLDTKTKAVTAVLLDNTSRPSYWDYDALQVNIRLGRTREIKRKPHPLKLK